MMFRYFNCPCGYYLLTPEKNPFCPVCGLPMDQVTDTEKIHEIDLEIDRKFRHLLEKIDFGELKK